MKRWIYLVFLLLLTGCFQVNSDDEEEDLRTIPITNNPLIVPQGGGGGFPSNFDSRRQ